MKIITIPEKVLLKKAKPVKEFDSKLKKIVDDMRTTLEACIDPVGVGLAAPQVGLPLRIFLMKPDLKSLTQTFINPTLVAIDPKYKPAKDAQSQTEDSLEGCLSIPKIWGPITRAHKVTLAWFDVAGKQYEKDFFDFEAIIIQHELDHLEGILFTHRSAEQNAPLYEEENKKLYEMKI